MSKTDEWIARENISRFRKQIAAAVSEQDKAALKRLLASEEAKLREVRKVDGAEGARRSPD